MSKRSAPMARRFWQFSLRALLVLVGAVAVLLGITAPWFQRALRQRHVQSANRSMLAAAASADLEGTAHAIASGADLQARDAEGCSALGYALKSKNHPLLDLLLRAGADPDSISAFGRSMASPLAFAVRENDVALARRLLEAGADPNGYQGFREYPLHFCIENGYVEMIELLLERGADIEAVNDSVGPPLHLAIASSQPPEVRLHIVRRLLEHGADIEATSYGCNAMALAVRHSHARVGELLVQYGAQYTPREAAAFNRLDDVKRMVKEDPALLTRRFDPVWAADPGQGPTLLCIALERGYREMGVFLLESGAPVDILVGLGETLLHSAARGGDPELVRLLLERGLDVNARDAHFEATPLHEAADRDRAEAAAVLIDWGADVNAQDGARKTPLRDAVYLECLQVARLLLAAGADPAIADRDGRTALDMARRAGNPDLLTLLEQTSPAKPHHRGNQCL